MKTLIALAVLVCATQAQAATVVKNDKVINSVLVSTTSAYSKVLDIGAADSASFQITATCATGQMKIQQGNDGINFVDLNVANSSITWAAASTSTVSNQLFSIATPAYRYLNFKMTNSSSPAHGAAVACSLSVTECIKSDTITSN